LIMYIPNLICQLEPSLRTGVQHTWTAPARVAVHLNDLSGDDFVKAIDRLVHEFR